MYNVPPHLLKEKAGYESMPQPSKPTTRTYSIDDKGQRFFVEKGVRYTHTENRKFAKNVTTKGVLEVWAGECRDCGSQFEVTIPLGRSGRWNINRRCSLCIAARNERRPRYEF